MGALEPVELVGRRVRLVPMELAHSDALWAALADPGIWTYTKATITSASEMRAWMAHLLDEVAAGTALAWTTVDDATGAVIGCTAGEHWDPDVRRIEIGGTRLAPPAHGTGINTEAKYLQLCHLFDSLGVRRVEFWTDTENARSIAAIEKLGAVREGHFRRHWLRRDGAVRDSYAYAITDLDWPGVKERLDAMVPAADR